MSTVDEKLRFIKYLGDTLYISRRVSLILVHIEAMEASLLVILEVKFDVSEFPILRPAFLRNAGHL